MVLLFSETFSHRREGLRGARMASAGGSLHQPPTPSCVAFESRAHSYGLRTATTAPTAARATSGHGRSHRAACDSAPLDFAGQFVVEFPQDFKSGCATGGCRVPPRG